MDKDNFDKEEQMLQSLNIKKPAQLSLSLKTKPWTAKLLLTAHRKGVSPIELVNKVLELHMEEELKIENTLMDTEEKLRPRKNNLKS